MPNPEAKESTRVWQEIDQLIHDWRGWSAYDDPLQGSLYGSVTSPCYLGHDELHKWMREHYVGSAGYDHKTGRIIHPKLRQFFDATYPDWQERPFSPEDDELSDMDTE